MKFFTALSFFCLTAFGAQAAQQQYATLAQLSDAERKYYALSFSYTMDAIAPGASYAWGSYSGKGNIAPQEKFISKSKSLCRKFTESFNIGGLQGGNDGVACKRNGDDGWCKLRKGQVMTCAMEKPGIMFDTDIPNVNIAGPNVNMPNMGSGVGGIGRSGSNISAPGAPPAFETAKSPTGNDVADTVTGAAGSVAGPAAGGMLKWFNSTFR
ncbi:MAG: hypothetical protein EBR02_03140 [Alphaproteobacteria bacterium]|nr:hypothetical protein [Alphaproteobacteria bacterium]